MLHESLYRSALHTFVIELTDQKPQCSLAFRDEAIRNFSLQACRSEFSTLERKKEKCIKPWSLNRDIKFLRLPVPLYFMIYVLNRLLDRPVYQTGQADMLEKHDTPPMLYIYSDGQQVISIFFLFCPIPSQGVSTSFFFCASWYFIEPLLSLLLPIAPLTTLCTPY